MLAKRYCIRYGASDPCSRIIQFLKIDHSYSYWYAVTEDDTAPQTGGKSFHYSYGSCCTGKPRQGVAGHCFIQP
eukprot:scaffold269415_cov32-Prasinocladus_malaysianus.AAC.2